MFNEVVHVRHWMDTQTFMDGIALGQITPGPIVITATFVGYQVAGLPGAIAATIGIFSPSFIMVNLAVPYFDRLQRSVVFKRALRGVLVCFVGLLLAVTIRMGLAVSWSFLSFAIAAAAFAALRFGIDILWVALAGVVVSCLLL
jgi:chromate transporter